MKRRVERWEGNEEARLRGDDLVIKANGCGEFGIVRAWVTQDQWLQDAEGSKGVRTKGGFGEPCTTKGRDGPFHTVEERGGK